MLTVAYPMNKLMYFLRDLQFKKNIVNLKYLLSFRKKVKV